MIDWRIELLIMHGHKNFVNDKMYQLKIWIGNYHKLNEWMICVGAELICVWTCNCVGLQIRFKTRLQTINYQKLPDSDKNYWKPIQKYMFATWRWPLQWERNDRKKSEISWQKLLKIMLTIAERHFDAALDCDSAWQNV